MTENTNVDVSDWYEKYRIEAEKRKQEATKTMWEALDAAGATHATAEYSGGGDEGWVESVEVFHGEDQVDEMEGGWGTSADDSDAVKAVEAFIYCALPGGWETSDGIYEGASGTVKIDVAERKATFNHFERVVEEKDESFVVEG